MRIHVLAVIGLMMGSVPAYAEEVNGELVLGGAAAIGVPYLVGVAVTAAADNGGNYRFDSLYVPVVGPFIAAGMSLADIGQHRSAFFSGAIDLFDGLGAVLFVADGVVQVAGVALIVWGMVGSKRVQVDTKPRIAFTPIGGKGTAGAALSGTF